MADKTPVMDAEGGSVISFDVTPNASRTEITGVNEWRKAVKVRLASRAMEGAANEELVRFVCEMFRVPISGVRLLRGHRSTMKSVFVPVPAERVRRLLGVK